MWGLGLFAFSREWGPDSSWVVFYNLPGLHFGLINWDTNMFESAITVDSSDLSDNTSARLYYMFTNLIV